MSSVVNGISTECSRCGQPLLLRREGRDVCERCRLGGPPQPTPEAAEPDEPAEQAAPLVPCAGCGRTVADGGFRLSLADRFCLSCRVLGRHR